MARTPRKRRKSAPARAPASGARSREALSRIGWGGQDPRGWGVPVGRWLGAPWRVHGLFIVFMVAEIVLGWPWHRVGPPYVALAMAALLVIAAAHEAGRLLACRAMGLALERVVLWPAGGLTEPTGPGGWRGVLGASGGLAGCAAVAGVAAAGLVGLGVRPDVLSFNPARPAPTLAMLPSYPAVLLWWLYALGVLVGVLNLMPMYPMDGARVLQAVLARDGSGRGARRAVLTAADAGMVSAGVLAVLAMVGGQGHLMGLAVLGGLVSWLERRRAAFALEPSDDPVTPAAPEPPAPTPALNEDTVLEKVSRQGLASLSAPEREVLERATRLRQRRSGRGGSANDARGRTEEESGRPGAPPGGA